MLLLFKKPRLQMLQRCTGFSLPPSDVTVMTVVIFALLDDEEDLEVDEELPLLALLRCLPEAALWDLLCGPAAPLWP